MNINQMIGTAKGVLSQVSPKAAQALDNPQLIQQATNAFNHFSHDKSGALQAVQAFGGMKMVDRAVSTVKKYPIVDFALRGMGIDVDKVKAELFGSDSNNGNNRSANSQPYKIAPSYHDRLNKLR